MASLKDAHVATTATTMPHSPAEDPAPPSILIVRSTQEEIYESAWHRALSDMRLSCDLFNTHAYMPRGISGRIQQRLMIGAWMDRANAALIDTVERRRPDITLLYQGHHLRRNTIDHIRKITFVTGYHNDDFTGPRRAMLRFRHLHASLQAYGGFHVYRSCNVTDLRQLGLRRVKVLRSYYIPWLDRPATNGHDGSAFPAHDVVFVGHAEPDIRGACFSAAVKAGIQVKLFGHGERQWKRWIPRHVLEANGPIRMLLGEEYRAALRGAKIATAFYSKWNRDQYSRRSFEIPACGTFMLSERTDVMHELYVEGKEAEFFNSAEEFVDKAKFYLHNDTARTRIAEAGYRRVTTSGYDIHSRMKQWLADVSQWREEAQCD